LAESNTALRAEAIAWLAMSSAEWDMTTCITEYCGHGHSYPRTGH